MLPGRISSVLRDGRWVIISIVPLPHPNAAHAIVLIHLNEDDQFLYLDPGEPLHVQPLAFSEGELVAQGERVEWLGLIDSDIHHSSLTLPERLRWLLWKAGDLVRRMRRSRR